jgi:hypothetical protein
VVAPDGRATSMQITNDIVATLGAGASQLHAEGSRGVADAVARLNDRSRPVAAILPSTALAFVEQTGSPSRDVHAHRYIAQLDVLTLHALASRKISNLRQLAGKKVNLGPRGSPTEATASVLLDQDSLRVDRLYLEHEQACAAVIRGEISAMMVLAAKPTRLFSDVDASDAVHFIPVPDPRDRACGILAARILPADYPMIGGGNGGAGRGVNTIAVPLVLGCFGWAAGTGNFMALAGLAGLLAEHGSGLPGFDIAAPVSGWRRFAPVEDWLAQGRSGSIRDYAAADTRPAAAHPQPVAPTRRQPLSAAAEPERNRPSSADTEPEQKEKLFQEFLSWRRNR